MNDPKTHWEDVYRAKQADEVSWFQREPRTSLDIIRRVASNRTARIIDVGGGTSSLVDRLLDDGYSNLTVLDVSATALTHARARLGVRASRVEWLDADIRAAKLPEASFDVWHDRAVFHFLTDAADREAYIRQIRHAVRPGGHVIVATFAEDGPTKCSGLPVVRYSPASLHHEFDGGFNLIQSVSEQHVTPSGQTQSFIYCLCQFVPNAIKSRPQDRRRSRGRRLRRQPRLSSRRSQALASRQSRLIVSGETFSTSAASSIPSPPKKRSSTT